MNLNNRSKGAHGERIAIKYLSDKGYELLDMNYWVKFGEVDLIMLHGEFIVFVEVKMRWDCDKGWPVEAVTPKKQKNIRQVANIYWQMGQWKNKQPRFDVIEIIKYEQNKTAIRHIVNAF